MVTTDSPGTEIQCRGCLCVDDATQLETGKEDAAIEGNGQVPRAGLRMASSSTPQKQNIAQMSIKVKYR